ncbi:hypothetical protein COX95_02600 [bacterium CG_4_10_14_0_2_um_filter_33_32]|nr:MAG: hypothetical protein AUJ93_00680 [bacterium CG2_30_33_46]PIR68035.1 MAG: hypothetical protein COU50_00085 [bacterium CG10_big_fil_rev_8_21_14_0_10_33_18]PIU76919.1 MAG: hypothetical protein COS74_01510 [bacterium CG06_land_8_20_14_3_00_33_50]PIW81030.1 MAG: hypothetical protein COZ97_03955 [bacterium CG_4_8_14_3_um_filter_33_28]PIY85397.1 MAG: hypothetical protein COY76_02315 [bacterium CG_4_10_14_0_8_um_filter_33_57]PIZ85926.1 MAG: hypothetical protein COX95_02600 [bacterium CG_4_10_1
MKFIKSGQGTLVEGKGYKKDVFIKNVDLISNKVLVQMIIIDPHGIAGDHYHKKTTEIFYFLEGKGIFIVEGKEHECFPGDILICEANEMHSTRNESDQA